MAINIDRCFRQAAQVGLAALALPWVVYGQDAPDPVASQPQQTVASNPDPSASATDPPTAAGGFRGRFRLHAYADVDYQRTDAAGAVDRFSVGEIDLFSTAVITPQLTALSEIVINTDGTASVASVPINVERLLLQYRVNDYLKVEAGQYRTSLGYYSNAYLRGAWFQTAITRPRMFAFEEDGGVLPLHTVGVSVSGEIPSGPWGLHYVVETGNARTWGSSSETDVTSHTAINFSVYARPRWVPGLEIGISDYHDRYTPFAGFTVDRGGVMGHVVYTARRFEFLNEGVVAHLYYGPANATATFSGFYSQLGYRVGRNWGPYARVEKLTVQADPFFDFLPQFAGVANWRSMYTGGVRYDWNEHIAIKAEGLHEADWAAPHYYQAALQIAFAF